MAKLQKGDLIRVGESDLPQQMQKAITPVQGRLIESAAEIGMSPATIDDACYLHTILCQVGMPRKRVGELTFERTNGSASLLLTAGKLFDGHTWVQQAIPYGPKPRLILINLTSHAVRHRSPLVDVGRSTREFMQRMRLDPQGSEYRSLRHQIEALAACRMQLGAQVENRIVSLDTQPIRRFNAWVVPNADQQTLWPGTVELSREYFDSILEAAVPLDERAVAANRGSALALDVYTWLAHRLCRVHTTNGVGVPWTALKGQFGHEYRNLGDFRKEFRAALKQVMQVYRDARIEETVEGLLLRSSPPPIPKVSVLVPKL